MEINTGLQVNIQSWSAQTPLEIVTEDNDQTGGRPVSLETDSYVFRATGWGIGVDQVRVPPLQVRKDDQNKPLNGIKVVKIFCSEADAVGLRILDGNGTAASSDIAASVTGRRNEPRTEALQWNGDMRQRLKYYYDAPEIEVINQTPFRNKTGDVVAIPQYDRARGEFFSPVEVYGALIVRYRPGFTLVNITYGNGSAVASPELFREMQAAWLNGDIHGAEVPQVSLFVMSGTKVASTQFRREFFPTAYPRMSWSIAPAVTEEQKKYDKGVYAQSGGEKVTKVIPSSTDPQTTITVEYDKVIDLTDINTMERKRFIFNV